MTKRDRITLAVLAAIALVAAAWLLAIKPKRQEAAALADEVAQAEQRRDTALATLAQANQARARFTDAQVGLARLGKAVPSDDDIATLVFQLGRSARRAGIDFRSVRLESAGSTASAGTDPTTTKQNGGGEITKLPFKLTFEGNFFELRRFLDHVGSLTDMREGKYVRVRGRLLSIEGVSLAAGSDGFPQLKAEISATAYSAPAPNLQIAGAGAQTASVTTPATDATPAASQPPTAEAPDATTSTEVAR